MTADEFLITDDTRWTRENDAWVQVRCFRFTRASDGKVSWADSLDENQLALKLRQDALRAEQRGWTPNPLF